MQVCIHECVHSLHVCAENKRFESKGKVDCIFFTYSDSANSFIIGLASICFSDCMHPNVSDNFICDFDIMNGMVFMTVNLSFALCSITYTIWL